MKLRLAILTNTLAPYRVPIYRYLAQQFEVAVFIAAAEPNRSTWLRLEEELVDVGVAVKRSWGFSIDRTDKFDHRYLHVTPGYLADLVRFKPHAVITNEMGPRTAIALCYAIGRRCPVWVWWGGTDHTERGIGVVKQLARKTLARIVRRWISYGVTSTDYLLSLGVDRGSILQIQNCVDETRFILPVAPKFSCNPRPVLLCVGQMIGRKGLSHLLDAAARRQRTGAQFSLLLVGDGQDRQTLIDRARTLGLENVSFRPAESPDDMPSVYRSGDVLVFPTLQDPWGLVVNEALWSGLPVVASTFAGCTAEIVPPENRFNPLVDDDFDRVLNLAVTGRLADAVTDELMTHSAVGQLIAEDILRAVGGHAA